MEVKEIKEYNETQILSLYGSVGWTAYTDTPEALRQGFANSLLTLGAYENNTLLGLIRVVGDGYTGILIQDILLYPQFQRQGIGTKLIQAVLEKYAHVRQIQLVTDDTEKTKAFYHSVGFAAFSEIGCCGFMKI